MDLGGLGWTWVDFGGVRASEGRLKVQSKFHSVGPWFGRFSTPNCVRLSVLRFRFVFVHSIDGRSGW